MEFPGMSNPSKLSDDDVNRIAEAIVEKAREDVGIRDVIIGSAMGKGAIPLYGRETRKEPCSCCLIDPEGPNAPENRMCTTKGAIGTLKDSEERNWCSEIKIVSDGRCARARAISEAARVCKEKHPYDTEAFFRCYIPAFSQATRGSNPDTGTSIIDLRGDYDEIAHVREGILYRKGNIVQVWWDKWGKETWTAPGEEQAKENFNAMKERWSSTELGNPKEPWQMTRDEFINYMKTMPRPYREALLGGEGRELVLEATRTGKSVHQLLVERALSEGKPVPPEVLADYPDLVARYGPGEIRLGEKMVEIPLDESGRAISPEEGNPGEYVTITS